MISWDESIGVQYALKIFKITAKPITNLYFNHSATFSIEIIHDIRDFIRRQNQFYRELYLRIFDRHTRFSLLISDDLIENRIYNF